MTPFGSGERLGPYEILDQVGAGGMGVVYRARDIRLGREVAVKVLSVSLAESPEAIRRFEFEARAAGSLDHPNVVTVHDIGWHQGAPYLVCEFLAGETLRRRLMRGALPAVEVRGYGLQIASALAVAHAKGIVHRDLKPENLFITADDRIKILDFGIAKLLPPTSRTLVDSDMAPTDIRTATGTIIGTVGYMAPEQIRGNPADHRSDIFALGLVLYEMLAGDAPFHEGSTFEVAHAILATETPPIPQAPGALFDVIRKCLRKDPAERYQSARELEQDLRKAGLAAETRVSLEGTPAIAASGLGRANRSPIRRALQAGAVVSIALAIAGAAVVATRLAKRAAPSFQQLTFRHGVVWSARFVPDGETIVYSAAWDGGPVQSNTTVAARSGSRAIELPPARVAAVSPTGELAVLLERPSESLDYMRLGTLARVPFAGGSPRELFTGVRAADWDPGSGDLVIAREADGKDRVEFPPGTLRYTSAGWISDARISPKGSIAVIEHPYFGDTRGVIVLLDPGKEPRPLTGELGGAMGIAWSPRGDEVWFSGGETSQSAGIRAVSLDGRQRLILETPGFMLHDVGRDGRVLLSRQTWRNWIRGRAPGPSAERDLSWLDYSLARDLSGDGRKFLFFEAGVGGGALFSAFERTMDGSPPVALGPGYALSMTDDGASILIGSIENPSQLIIVPAGAGQPRKLQLPVAGIAEARWFPRGTAILVTARETTSGPLRLFIADAQSGKLRPLTEQGVPGQQTILKPVSPDGTRVLVRRHDGYFVYPAAGGTPSPVKGVRTGQIPIGWHGDGRSLVVREPGLPAKVSRVDLEDGAQRPLRELKPPDAGGVSDVPWVYFSGKGDAYVYSYHQILSDLYVVRGIE